MIYDYSWPVILALSLGILSGVELGFLILLGVLAYDKTTKGRMLAFFLFNISLAVFAGGAWVGWNGGARAQLSQCKGAHQ